MIHKFGSERKNMFKMFSLTRFSQVETGNLSLTWPIMLNPVSWDGKIIKKCLLNS
jgi:hypothetical protein